MILEEYYLVQVLQQGRRHLRQVRRHLGQVDSLHKRKYNVQLVVFNVQVQHYVQHVILDII